MLRIVPSTWYIVSTQQVVSLKAIDGNSRCTARGDGAYTWGWVMMTLQIPPLAISTWFTRSQDISHISPGSSQGLCSSLLLSTAHSEPSSGADLIRNFHHTRWVIGKACSLCRPASFQATYQWAGTGVCVTLSCSQGFPLPSPHPGFTSGIGPVLHNRSQGDSKV